MGDIDIDDIAARLEAANDSLKRRDLVDRMTAGRDDDVGDLNAGLLRGTSLHRIESAHFRAANLREARGARVRRRNFIQRDADHGTTNLAELNEIIHHLLRERDRNRESVTRVVTRAARDRAVDADDFAANVEQRSTRIAWVDRGIGLDVVSDCVAVATVRIEQRRLIAALRAHDAGGDGEVELKRISDRQYPLPNPSFRIVAEGSVSGDSFRRS